MAAQCGKFWIFISKLWAQVLEFKLPGRGGFSWRGTVGFRFTLFTDQSWSQSRIESWTILISSWQCWTSGWTNCTSTIEPNLKKICMKLLWTNFFYFNVKIPATWSWITFTVWSMYARAFLKSEKKALNLHKNFILKWHFQVTRYVNFKEHNLFTIPWKLRFTVSKFKVIHMFLLLYFVQLFCILHSRFLSMNWKHITLENAVTEIKNQRLFTIKS